MLAVRLILAIDKMVLWLAELGYLILSQFFKIFMHFLEKSCSTIVHIRVSEGRVSIATFQIFRAPCEFARGREYDEDLLDLTTKIVDKHL